MRAKVRTLVAHTVIEKETVFGQPVFGLNARELIRDVSTHCVVCFVGGPLS
jgi:hypothetical protein